MILFYACLFSIYISIKMKSYYSSENFTVMWHDDYSMGTTVFIFVGIIVSTCLFIQFHGDMIRIRKLIKFNHFYEFEQDKLSDS